MLRGDVAREIVVGMTGNVAKVTSCHDVRIDIDRIDGVGDAYDVVGSQYVANVACIAFRSIADEDLIAVETDASGGEVVSDDGIDEEVVTLLRSLAAKGARVGIFFNRLTHRTDRCRGERTGHITDSKLDDVGLGVCALICAHLSGYLGKEIAT